MAFHATQKIKELNDNQKIELSYEMQGKTIHATPGNTELEQLKKDLEALANKHSSGPVKVRIQVIVHAPPSQKGRA